MVGSGPGGAGVARELARGGARVLVVERGRADPPSGRARQSLRELFMPGRSLFRTGSVLVLRGVTLGGSSMYFFGSAWEPPHALLRAHGLDLRADADALRRELRPAALPRELMGPRAGRLMDSAQALGLDWQPIPKFVDQDLLRREGLGAYGAARWTARSFVDDAVGAGARLVTRAAAVRVVVRSGAACGVELRVGGRRRVVNAGRVVLAAGGLGSPMILRASGIERAGRDFFYDPVLAVSGTVDGLDADAEPPMLAAVDRLDDGYLLTDLCRPQWLHNAFTVAAGRPDRVLAYRSTLTVMVKARDALSGALTRRGGVAKPLTAADRAILDRGAAQAREILRHAGARVDLPGRSRRRASRRHGEGRRRRRHRPADRDPRPLRLRRLGHPHRLGPPPDLHRHGAGPQARPAPRRRFRLTAPGVLQLVSRPRRLCGGR